MMKMLNFSKNKKFNIFMITLLLSLFFVCVKFAYADWVKSDKGYMYVNSATNQYVVNNWIQTSAGYFYLDANGLVVVGWQQINGKNYYFNSDGLMQVGFVEVNGNKYYLDEKTGQLVTGWVQTYVDGVIDYYYFDEQTGAMVLGWKQINNKWYYFYNNKALIDTWAKINEIWYHFNIKGYMDTGWIIVSGKMFYLNLANGSLTKGWIQDQNGNEYYLSEADGSLAINTTISINGRNYTFDDTGKCIAKDNYTNASNGRDLANIGVLGYGQGVSVSGVNPGISPETNTVGNNTSVQSQYNANNSLQSGLTTGPR